MAPNWEIKLESKHYLTPDKYLSTLFSKWGLQDSLRTFQLTFRGRPPQDEDEIWAMISDIFRNLELGNNPGENGRIEDLREKIRKLDTNVQSMDFWNKLQEQGLVSSNGHIKQILPEYVDDMLISDTLRAMFFNRDSEYWDIFTEDEKNEAIYHVMKLVIGGGPLCQPEDYVDEYLEVAKYLYKKLVRVYKEDKEGSVEVSALIRSIEEDSSIFPTTSVYNLCLVSIDRIAHEVIVLYKTRNSKW